MNPLEAGASFDLAPGTAAPIASATSGDARWTVRGEVVAVAPEGGMVDVAAGAPSYGAVYRIFIPDGLAFSYGDRQVPIGEMQVGDRVRIDYTTDTLTGEGAPRLIASTARILLRAGADAAPADDG
jgi:hypothetical protein